jgi:hypothetical protein
LGGIYKASAGQPFTPLLGGDPLGAKLDETAEPPNRLAGPGCQNLSNPGNPSQYIKPDCFTLPQATPAIASQCVPFGFSPPTSAHPNPGIPGLSNLDFSVFKNNFIRRISESFNAQFRAEFFNVFNRANFSSPTDNRVVFDQSGNRISSAGLITSTQTPSRQIQFAVKLIW